MKIDKQDITDAEKERRLYIYRKAAEEAISKGEIVYVSERGDPIGKADTIEDLNMLIENKKSQH